MAEWGKYLKNAVANVEQQLDKVLLEQQNTSSTPSNSTPSDSTGGQTGRRSNGGGGGRPDLSERLRKAANGRAKPNGKGENSKEPTVGQEAGIPINAEPQDGNELNTKPEKVERSITEPDSLSETHASPALDGSSESQSQPELIISPDLVPPPDLGEVLMEARQVALAVRRDDTLLLVDNLEKAQSALTEYSDRSTERLKSAISKITLLSQERMDSSTGLEHKVALLMDEGNRLSKRELELNMTVKKLKAERTTTLSKIKQVTAKDSEISGLRAQIEQSEGRLKESQALVEHYRSLAESNSLASSSTRRSTDGRDDENGDAKRDLRIEVLQRHHSEERAKWHGIESNLLSRIAELEHNIEMKSNTTEQLHKSLKDAQSTLRASRDQLTVLQDDLDATREAHTAAETRFQAQINDLTTELIVLKQQQAQQEQHQQHGHDPLDAPTNSNMSASDGKNDDDLLVRANTPKLADFEENVRSALSPPPESADPATPLMDDAESLQRSQDPLYLESEAALSQLDRVAVGPAGPFGVLADDYGQNFTQSDISRFSAGARDTTDDSLSILNNSRRESSIHGSELVQGSQVHLVRKLTMSVRRLENELSSASKLAEIANQQRDEAQAEVVKLVDAQEQLHQLVETHSKLEEAHKEMTLEMDKLKQSIADKDERIEELDADVRDLKDMYKEQIEALITEIEALRAK